MQPQRTIIIVTDLLIFYEENITLRGLSECIFTNISANRMQNLTAFKILLPARALQRVRNLCLFLRKKPVNRKSVYRKQKACLPSVSWFTAIIS